jgi:hypothetical protein
MLLPRLTGNSIVCLTLLLAAGVGCQSKYSHIAAYQPTTQPLSVTPTEIDKPEPLPEVDALVTPPAGWAADPIKSSEQHKHQVWKSPSGKTAYGIIHFSLPLPVPATWVLDPFLKEMKKSEGEANLLGPPLRDDALPGVRFTVEGGDYRMRINLICKGFRGWAVYAGTLRKEEEVPAELHLAEAARDRTKVGVPSATGQPTPALKPTASASE